MNNNINECYVLLISTNLDHTISGDDNYPKANLYSDMWHHVYVASAERVQYASVSLLGLANRTLVFTSGLHDYNYNRI